MVNLSRCNGVRARICRADALRAPPSSVPGDRWGSGGIQRLVPDFPEARLLGEHAQKALKPMDENGIVPRARAYGSQNRVRLVEACDLKKP